MRKAIAITAAITALGLGGSVQAGPYYLKIKGVEGESSESGHKDWILLQSVTLVDVKSTGGANVASGDANEEGMTRTTSSSQARAQAPTAGSSATGGGGGAGKVSMRSATQSSSAQGLAVADPADPVPAALLLPAVQKVRSASLKTSAWPGCNAGQRLGVIQIRDEDGNRTGQILDATVKHCTAEQVSLNFSKIKW